jgi:hypothetical protein
MKKAAVVRQGKIPFEISVDPFWSEANNESQIDLSQNFP